MEQKMKKNDKILIAVVLLVAIVSYFGISFFQKTNTQNAEVVILIDGSEYASFPLNRDRVERIELSDGSYNVLEIKDGKADVTEASCPDGICVSHRAVSKQRETITCLPNKLVVEVRNGETSDLDAVTN